MIPGVIPEEIQDYEVDKIGTVGELGQGNKCRPGEESIDRATVPMMAGHYHPGETQGPGWSVEGGIRHGCQGGVGCGPTLVIRIHSVLYGKTYGQGSQPTPDNKWGT